jgi:hypothetical protein
MKGLRWFSILLACSPALVSAQNEHTAALSSGTKINAALESTLDARIAKPGDPVRAKVTKDIKQNHQATGNQCEEEEKPHPSRITNLKLVILLRYETALPMDFSSSRKSPCTGCP